MSRVGDPAVTALELDEMVYQRVRLTLLKEVPETHLSFLRRALALTDGILGRLLGILVNAGYLVSRKGYDGRRTRTWARISEAGRAALANEVQMLKAVVERVENAGACPS